MLIKMRDLQNYHNMLIYMYFCYRVNLFKINELDIILQVPQNEYIFDKTSDLCLTNNRLYPADSLVDEIINGISTSGYVTLNTESNRNPSNGTLTLTQILTVV